MDQRTQLVETPTYPLEIRIRRGGSYVVRDAGYNKIPIQEGTDIFWRLKGELYPMVTIPDFQDKTGNIVIVTDGTLKNGRGGAAYIVTSTDTPGTVKAVLPVDCGGCQMTSYRTELFGILGALLTLRELLQTQDNNWKHLTGTLWCDNKGAVTKFNDLEDETPFSLTIVNQTDADVLQELRVVKN